MASLAPESNGAHTHTGPAAVHPEASNGSISTSSNGGAAVAPSEAAGGAATAAAQTASVVLEREMPLPDSMLWKLQQAFYEEVCVVVVGDGGVTMTLLVVVWHVVSRFVVVAVR